MAQINDRIRFQVPANYPNNIACVANLNERVKTGTIIGLYGLKVAKIGLDIVCSGCYCCCESVILDETAFKVE